MTSAPNTISGRSRRSSPRGRVYSPSSDVHRPFDWPRAAIVLLPAVELEKRALSGETFDKRVDPKAYNVGGLFPARQVGALQFPKSVQQPPKSYGRRRRFFQPG